MRFITPVVYAGLLAASIYTALAQGSPIHLASVTTTEDVRSPGPSSLAEKTPVKSPAIEHHVKPVPRLGHRELCRREVSARHLRHREARDQLQLCMAEARVDCLRQAIHANIHGVAKRRLYVRACIAS